MAVRVGEVGHPMAPVLVIGSSYHGGADGCGTVKDGGDVVQQEVHLAAWNAFTRGRMG